MGDVHRKREMWWKCFSPSLSPFLLNWKPKCHHPGNGNSTSYTMVRLSGKGKDKIMNFIKVTTVPSRGKHPDLSTVEVLIFHVPGCCIFTCAPCTLGNQCAFEESLLSGLTRTSQLWRSRKKAEEKLDGKSADDKPSLVRLHV